MKQNKNINIDIILTFTAAILAFASVVTVLSFIFIGKNVAPAMKELEELETRRKAGYHTFVIAGLDTTSNNTDVLMLASLDTNTGDIKILQIPRDTFISKDVTGYKSTSRINGVFVTEYNRARNEGMSGSRAQKAAMEKLKTTIGDALGTEIDDYVLISVSAFRTIVDAVGGVWFDVPYDMDYEDPYQDLYIHLKTGYQLLDGDHAEQLIRFRETTTADIGRTGVRGNFLMAMAKQVKENLGIGSALTIVGELISKTVTSIDIGEAVKFTRAVYSAPLDAMEIKTVTCSSVYDAETGKWTPCVYLNRRGALDDVNRYVNVYKEDIFLENFDADGLFLDRENDAAAAYYNREDIK